MDETGMVFALGNEAADKMREPHVLKKETPKVASAPVLYC